MDVTSASASFVAENSDLVAKFLKVTADANTMWADEANHAAMLPAIAKDAGMDEQATMETIATFKFPTVEEQLSSAWLGGNAPTFMKGVADVFLEAGSLDAPLAPFAHACNTGPPPAAART